jgi:hypothetical protein
MVIEILLGVSLFANLILIGLALYYKSQKRKWLTESVTKTQDALEVLHDLRLHGQSLVRIERLDASDIYLKGTR